MLIYVKIIKKKTFLRTDGQTDNPKLQFGTSQKKKFFTRQTDRHTFNSKLQFGTSQKKVRNQKKKWFMFI